AKDKLRETMDVGNAALEDNLGANHKLQVRPGVVPSCINHKSGSYQLAVILTALTTPTRHIPPPHGAGGPAPTLLADAGAVASSSGAHSAAGAAGAANYQDMATPSADITMEELLAPQPAAAPASRAARAGCGVAMAGAAPAAPMPNRVAPTVISEALDELGVGQKRKAEVMDKFNASDGTESVDVCTPQHYRDSNAAMLPDSHIRLRPDDFFRPWGSLGPPRAPGARLGLGARPSTPMTSEQAAAATGAMHGQTLAVSQQGLAGFSVADLHGQSTTQLATTFGITRTFVRGQGRPQSYAVA
ncbi:unnamed protein product, partial [Prorocentrum cordatum]